MEKLRERKKDLQDLHMISLTMSRDLIWCVLQKKRVTKGYVDVVKNMYDEIVTTIRLPTGEPIEFSIIVGLH